MVRSRNGEAIIRRWTIYRKALDYEISKFIESNQWGAAVDAVKYINTGGKRFRGFLTLLTAEALGGSLDKAIPAAVAIELVHAASLALDDIIDGDTERRGRPSAWVAEGVGKASLSSLLLIAEAQKLTERYGFTAIKNVIRSWEEIVRGEIMDAYMVDNLDPADYPTLIEYKTASLFRLATVLGSIASTGEVHDAASRYGRLIGVLYQVADDLSDYLRKPGPSELLFARWVTLKTGIGDVVDAAMKIIGNLIKEAGEAALQIAASVDEETRTIIVSIPRFMVAKLLEESGLSFTIAE